MLTFGADAELAALKGKLDPDNLGIILWPQFEAQAKVRSIVHTILRAKLRVEGEGILTAPPPTIALAAPRTASVVPSKGCESQSTAKNRSGQFFLLHLHFVMP